MNSPLTIKIVLHYYLATSDTKDYEESPAFKRTIKYLLGLGIVKTTPRLANRKYDANIEACKVYVNALCATPFPVQGWVMPKTKN